MSATPRAAPGRVGLRARFIPLLLTLAALLAGAVAAAVGAGDVARRIWMAGLVVLGAPIVFRTMRGALQGRLATDVVASLSVIGAIVLAQPLAGLVIVLMQTGGEALELYAEGRASAAVRALEAAAPRVAHRVSGDVVEEINAASVDIGNVLLVRPGDLIPCDGVILDGESQIDTSSLTGEAAPVRATAGIAVMSGTTNGLGSFRMRVSARAEQSQYARIVEMVRSAQASKAPLQRVADRYAVWFTPITVSLCAIAVWVTNDWMRALAILVVATPCPLILATPVAIIGGINRGAKRFVIIRRGGALERLAEVTVAVFDKTGTLTVGKPSVDIVHIAEGFDRATVLRYAASVEEHSSHLLARVLVEAARCEVKRIPPSTRQLEAPGEGVDGVVEGHRVRVGARAFVLPWCTNADMAAALERSDATLRAYVAIDHELAATIDYADAIRPELPGVLAALTAAGVHRIVLLSGDQAPIARAVAAKVGIKEVHGELLPADKARFIERMRADGGVVMMVGDGTNDAPALSAADVGVALAAHGGGITAEAADVVVLVDDLDRVADAVAIGQRTLRIARQSIRVGLGLSGIAMIVAAFGKLPPIAGAALQEVIDVAVIFNALRTSAEPRSSPPPSGKRFVGNARLSVAASSMKVATSAVESGND